MENSKEIDFYDFVPREYQEPVFEAMENGIKKFVLVWNRRAGKDMVAFLCAIRHMLQKPTEVYYVFPTFAQARRSIYESISNEGKRIIDYLPEDLIDNRNDQTMRIRLKNGSLIRWVGSNKWSDLKGGNPSLIIFSEFSKQDYRAYSEWAKPILTMNNGIALFVSTPFGRNHFWKLFNIANKNNKEWFSSFLTLHETAPHLEEQLERDIQSGEISRTLAQQEYYCNWNAAEEGFVYAKQINDLRLAEQIGRVPYNPEYLVHVAMDIGWDDSTFLIWFQALPGGAIHIIDCYENNREKIAHYVNVIRSKPYGEAGNYFGPHDLKVHEQGTGFTRIDFWRKLGIPLKIVPKVSLRDGIEAARCLLPRVWIDEVKCSLLISCLEKYEQEWDEEREVFRYEPIHNKWSHGADAFRYLSISINKLDKGLTPEDLERNYREAVYGESYKLPKEFRE